MKRNLLIALIWLAAWQLLALLIHNPIVLSGPWETGKALWELASQGAFWRSLWLTGLRVFGGLAAGCLLGVALGYAAWRLPVLRSALATPVAILKAAPVVSFVLLLLIWGGSRSLSFWISLFVVFPIFYHNTLEGFLGCDRGLLELGTVFRLSGRQKWRWLYGHALSPVWRSALHLAAGMAWKSGIAAEVLGQPLNSIGNGLYRAKIYLDTAGVLAWTATAILLSLLTERLLLWGFDRIRLHAVPASGGKETAPTQQAASAPLTLTATRLGKRYGQNTVLSALDLTLRSGEFWLVQGPSAVGKTTLLRLILGLEAPDQGTLTASRSYTCAAVFQEDRLLPELTALQNVRLGARQCSDAQIIADLDALLGPGSAELPVSGFSGGMRRRVALVRACLAPSDVLVLDEPFTGLDAAHRARAMDYVRQRANGRLVLIAAHGNDNLEDCQTVKL